jgi:hypothetical protein
MTLYEKMYNMPDEATEAEKIAALPRLTHTQLECLEQLISPVWDGNLISKQGRSDLVAMGLVERCDGLNFATQDGYTVLKYLGQLADNDRFIGGKPWRTYVKN